MFTLLMIKDKEHLPHRSRLKCNIITGRVLFLQKNDGSGIELTTKTNKVCNVIPIVKFIHTGKFEFKKLWKIVEDGVNHHWHSKVACLVFVPCNIDFKHQKLSVYHFDLE